MATYGYIINGKINYMLVADNIFIISTLIKRQAISTLFDSHHLLDMIIKLIITINKILKSDSLSAVLISALILQYVTGQYMP